MNRPQVVPLPDLSISPCAYCRLDWKRLPKVTRHHDPTPAARWPPHDHNGPAARPGERLYPTCQGPLHPRHVPRPRGSARPGCPLSGRPLPPALALHRGRKSPRASGTPRPLGASRASRSRRGALLLQPRLTVMCVLRRQEYAGRGPLEARGSRVVRLGSGADAGFVGCGNRAADQSRRSSPLCLAGQARLPYNPAGAGACAQGEESAFPATAPSLPYIHPALHLAPPHAASGACPLPRRRAPAPPSPARDPAPGGEGTRRPRDPALLRALICTRWGSCISRVPGTPSRASPLRLWRRKGEKLP